MTELQSHGARAFATSLLAEQRDLSAVGRFAQWHKGHAKAAGAYRNLIPLDKPQPGQQYAFEVDLDKCSGCKACVSACHSLNGLDEGEAWRDVGLLVSDDWRQPFQQTITTACHHCVDPACLNGCPVLAYDKDPLTGIVRHLDDQCIGCQYCVMKCPYDVPKYSERRGIVRKCDMCSSRLAAKEAPACAQACPNEAIRITVVEQATLGSAYRTNDECRMTNGKPKKVQPPFVIRHSSFLPDSPAPDYTLPTTRYKTARAIPGSVRAADREELHPQPAHTPLVFMLVLSQLSAGLFLFQWLLDAPGRVQALAALISGAVGIAASALHLGRPLGAWRSFLGLRKSWLSREIVAFGLYLPLAAAYTASLWVPEHISASARIGLGLATVIGGLLGVFCSVMIYHDTRREFWNFRATFGRFFGTTALLGTAGTLVVIVAIGGGPILRLSALLVIAGAFKLAVECRIFRHLAAGDFSPLHKTALLLTERFGLVSRCRIACLLVGAAVLPGLLAVQVMATGPAVSAPLLSALAAIIFILCLAGELLERQLFFLAVQPVKMPGDIGS